MTSITERIAGKTVAGAFVDTVAEPRRRRRAPVEGGRRLERVDLRRAGRPGGRVPPAACATSASGAGDRIVLMMRNSPEFHVLDVAALMVGATPISIYNSSAPDQVEYLVGHSGAVLGIVEDDSFLARFEPVRAELPDAARRSASCTSASSRPTSPGTTCIGAEPGRPGRGRGRGRPERPGHGHLHVGHHRPAQGRDDLERQRACSWPRPPATSCRSTTARRQAGRVVPARWPTSPSARSATTRSWCWATRSAAAPSPARSPPTAPRSSPHVLFGVPRVWEKIYAGADGRPGRRPREGGAVRRGRRGRPAHRR